MLNQKLFFFIVMLLLNVDAKAFVMSALPSSLLDTCVEINLKSGTRIVRKTTSSIKVFDADAKSVQKKRVFVDAEKEQSRKNKAKQTRIVILKVACVLSLLSIFLFGIGLLIFAISAVWGLIEVLSFKIQSVGRDYSLIFFILMNLLLLFLVVLIIFVAL